MPTPWQVLRQAVRPAVLWVCLGGLLGSTSDGLGAGGGMHAACRHAMLGARSLDSHIAPQ